MPVTALAAAWTKIGSAGQAVEIQNLSAAAIQITTATSLPGTVDGLVLGPLDTRVFALTADLYARALGGGPAAVEVMGGFTLPVTGGTAVPFATALPAITGSPAVGQTLTAGPGSWTGAPTGYAYQWLRGSLAISGATAAAYAVASSDIGSALAVTVTATNAAGSATATSQAVAATAAPSASAATGTGADFSDPANAVLLAALAA